MRLEKKTCSRASSTQMQRCLRTSCIILHAYECGRDPVLPDIFQVVFLRSYAETEVKNLDMREKMKQTAGVSA